MDLFVESTGRRTTSRDLFDQIRAAIESGRLAIGDRLPPSREVAEELGVARSTVTTVYGRLAAEGFVEGRAGAGSFVTSAPRDLAPREHTVALSARAAVVAALPPPVGADARPVRFDMRSGLPDPTLFPVVEWRRCVVDAYQTKPDGYSDPGGLPHLRRALAHWIGRSRGVEADFDQIVVTAGAQQAIDLVIRLLVDPGQVVAMEDPGYPAVRRLAQSLGAKVVPVPVDADGIVVSAIPPSARVVYVTPSHQSPTGVTMSLDRRRDLLRLAERYDIAIVEDDYDSENRHVDRPLEPLHRLDRSGRVVYVCTFSKVLSPSLRLGFAVLPDSLVEPARQLRSLMDGNPPTALQHAMHRFIVDGTLERHLRRARRIYRDRHGFAADRAVAMVDDGALLSVPIGNAGLHLAARLPDGVAETDVRDRARDRGVALGNLAESWAGRPAWEGVVIGFGAVATSDLPDAFDGLAAALR